MSFTKRCVAWTGLGLALVLLTGCPFPQLSVTPLTIALGGDVTSANFRIENTGGGTLNYKVTEDLPWVEISSVSGGKEDGVVEGAVTTDVAFIQVLLNRSALPAQGVTRGEISITSDGGDQTVIVSASQSGEPVLQVSRTSIDFGLTGTTEQFTITNGGNASLEWTLGFPATATWLNVQPASGTLESFGKQAVVTVNVSRSGISAQTDPYTSSISIVSNGGNAGVDVSMNVPPFSVQPAKVDFGRTEGVKTQSLTVENNGTLPVVLAISASTDSGGNWLSVDNAAATLPVPGPLQVTATANATGLAPGSYTGNIKVEATALAYSQIVPVTLSVPGFTVAPSALAFGTISDPATLPLTLANLGATPIKWTAAVSANTPWMSMSAASGTLTGTQTINVTATPSAVDPGDYAATITFTFDGGEDTVDVTMTRPKPPALKVAPQDMDFGVTRTETTAGIWNDGLGTINWSIDTSGFPAWLSLTPVDGSGVASGTVSGDITDTIAVRVDRTKAPDLEVFDFTFNVVASGDSTTPVPVRVHATAPQLPQFGLVGEGVDALGVPYARLDIAEDTQDFVVVNTGEGTLTWNIQPGTVLPAWITSISPQQGTVDPGRQQTVRITVDRSTLTRAGAVFKLPLVSNDPSNPILVIEIQIRVPYSIVIGVKPGDITFGRFSNTDLLAVANLGDAGEYLNFKVTSTQPTWLFVEPPTGRSIGVPASQSKDWQAVSVAIDRSRITGEGGVAKLIVEAVDVPEDALPVDPVEVKVSVDLAKLTVETAVTRLRPPSLVRMNVLLRDQAYKALASLEDIFTDTRTFYNVTNVLATFAEDSQALDLNETNTFVKKDEKLRFDVFVMLDYSGSMLSAAQALVDDGQLVLLPGENPLDKLYVQCIGPMLAEFPEHYRVALAVFNERRYGLDNDLRIIYGADPAHPQFATDAFVHDKEVLDYRINHTNVEDNGATALLPAVVGGAATLYGIDNCTNLIPFDTSDESILVAVTDGRRTTPPGDLATVANYMEDRRVRFFPIGWGQAVQANTLITLSSGSGGHYYSSQTKKNADGVEVPQASELLNWCRTEPGNSTAQSLPRDLRSHISISYPSLNESAGVVLDARLELLDTTPSVNGSATISGVPLAYYAHDVRLGQIGMRTEGINADSSGVTSVFVYMDYAPRNLNRLNLQLNVESPDSGVASEVVTVPEEQGGLVSDWVRTDTGDQYSFVAPEGRTFRYGDYGGLVEVRVTGAVNPFKVRLAVLDPVIGADRDGKYFTHPDTITVGAKPYRAPSLPRLAVKGVVPLTADFISPRVDGSVTIVPTLLLSANEGAVEINVYNRGGAHPPTDVQLYWVPRLGTGYASGTQPGGFKLVPEAGGGPVALTEAPGTQYFIPWPGESDPPGLYSLEVFLDWTYGDKNSADTMNITGTDGPYYLMYELGASPKLGVTQHTLDFGDSKNHLPLCIRNSSVGDLAWDIPLAQPPSSLPAWLKVNVPAADPDANPATPPYPLGSGGATVIYVAIDRTLLPAGDNTVSFDVTGDNGDVETVVVHAVN